MTSTTLETKAAALEGLDFIETEEDVKAVEAATLKIQSTFRGKKIRSRATTASGKQDKQQEEAGANERRSSVKDKESSELSARVAQMQVQDNSEGGQMDKLKRSQKSPAASSQAPLEDEAQRAATKIQAGFKGYKTRKELEGKLPGATSGSSGQQEGATAAAE